MNGMGMRNRIRPLMVFAFVFAVSACATPVAEPHSTDTRATASATPSPSATPSTCVVPTATAAASGSPEALIWSPNRTGLDWPGRIRAEPPGCAQVVFVAPRSEEAVLYRDPDGDVAPRSLAVVDIVTVGIREGCWRSLTTEACIFFDLADVLPDPPDPRVQWVAFGIVVDTTGDGRPDTRFGVENGGADGGRMWRTDLATGTTIGPRSGIGEDDKMDAHFPLDRGCCPELKSGHIFVSGPGPAFRFYVWASAIADGQIVAIDYAPDAGWIELDPSTAGPGE